MSSRPKRIRKLMRLNDYYYPENENQKHVRRKTNEVIKYQNKSPNQDSDSNAIPPPIFPRVEVPVVPVPTVSHTTIPTTSPEVPPKMTQKEILNKIYTDVNFPSAYSGDVRRFLLQKESLSRHRRKLHIFKRRKVYVGGPYQLIQADLIFYRNYARKNSGYQYILAVIDCFRLLTIIYGVLYTHQIFLAVKTGFDL